MEPNMRLRTANNKPVYLWWNSEKSLWYLSSTSPGAESDDYKIPMNGEHLDQMKTAIEQFFATRTPKQFTRKFENGDRNTEVREDRIVNANGNALAMDDHDKEWLLNTIYRIQEESRQILNNLMQYLHCKEPNYHPLPLPYPFNPLPSPLPPELPKYQSNMQPWPPQPPDWGNMP